MSAFRAALRISRRDAARAKGRSALIMVMIGLPVLLITGLLTLSQTTKLSARDELPSRLGSVADAAVYAHLRRTPVDQDPAGRFAGQPQTGERPPGWTTAEVTALTGGRLLPFHQYTTEARLTGGFGRVGLLEIDLRDPLGTGVRPLVRGRYPATPQEIAVTPALADAGVPVGSTLQVARSGEPKRVVGVVEHPNRPGISEIVALYDSVRPPEGTWRGPGWLADTPAPVTWQDVKRLNQAGVRVASRAVVESPRTDAFDAGSGRPDQRLWVAIAVLLVVTQTVLLAGPAFAVGLRRRGRELATIAAQGGSPRHLRTIVLADGLLLGGAAALIGAALGVGTGAIVEAVVARSLDWTSGPPDIPWWQVLGVAALGLVSALVAAVAPAAGAARQSPAQVLAGRAAKARERVGVPVLGLVLVLLGVATMFTVASRNDLGVVASATVTLFGLIALTPWLVGRTGRLAVRLPLPARLSIRDGARHRARTASAVAAVMAATMGAVTVGIAYNTTYVERREESRLAVPEGTLIVDGDSPDDHVWSEVRAAMRARLPGATFVPGLAAVDDQGRELATFLRSPAASSSPYYGSPFDLSITGDARLLALFQGRRDPSAEAALAAGRAVVFDPRLISDGAIDVTVQGGEEADGVPIRIPAVRARGAQAGQGGAVIPASVLKKAGFETAERRLYATLPQPVPDHLEPDLQALAIGASVVVIEDDSDEQYALMLGALLAAAVILVLGGTFAATGLAAADMRRDLDTLSAVGGPPLTRRLVVAAQAGYIAGLGAVTGLVAGLVTATAMTQGMRMARVSGGLALPWPFLAALVLGLPLLAALIAGAFTRTRPAPARRVA
ncbi:FtsX-like permease family protein [Nonomuraea fuscirosea]|uniref:FtsX-like permease family protein n=1 Tax=Nonomuraea fuscirosea TaxID=1291556 RepID=UPI00341295B3